MRFIKLGVISIVFFALLITGISLLLPSTVYISRAIDINAPVETAYNNVSNLANWKNWYVDYDSATAVLSANTTRPGASLRMQKLSIKLVEVTPAQVKAIWQNGESMQLPGEFNFISQPGATQMTLQWKFKHTVKWYPWQKFASILSDKAIGPSMEKSLQSLKDYVEKS
ncbi:MAG TPA: SRPBCC family protein [Segetibacter sp.]|jgi:hypothetical protein